MLATPVCFTRAQFYAILDQLDPDSHYELLDGVIYIKPRANPPHSGTVKFFANRLAREVDSELYQIQTQDGLEVNPYQAPEIDVCVLKASANFYSSRHPNGEDAELVIEVGDTERNPQDKMRVHMRDGRIPLAWRIDVPGRCVEIWTPADVEKPRDVLRGDDQFSFEGVKFTVNEIPVLRA